LKAVLGIESGSGSGSSFLAESGSGSGSSILAESGSRYSQYYTLKKLQDEKKIRIFLKIINGVFLFLGLLKGLLPQNCSRNTK